MTAYRCLDVCAGARKYFVMMCVCVCVCVCVDELHGCVSVGIGVYFLVRRYVRGIFVALTLRIRINVFA